MNANELNKIKNKLLSILRDIIPLSTDFCWNENIPAIDFFPLRQKDPKPIRIEIGIVNSPTQKIGRDYFKKMTPPIAYDPQTLHISFTYNYEQDGNHTPEERNLRRQVFHRLNKDSKNSKEEKNTHITRWSLMDYVELKDATKYLGEDTFPDDFISSSKNILNKLVKTLNDTNSEIKLMSEQGISPDDDIVTSIQDSLIKRLEITPEELSESASDIYTQLNHKELTEKNFKAAFLNCDTNKREDLLKLLFESYSKSEQSNKGPKELVWKMLDILFPNHQYISETKETGPPFLQALLEKNFNTKVKILSKDPIYDVKGNKKLRSYPETYAIEGSDYYVSNKWSWNGTPALKASKIIPMLCEEPYVTEEARKRLQSLAEQWQNNKITDEKESTGCWLLVADPAEFRFSDKKIGEQDFYTILNDEGNPRQKPWCYDAAKAGDKLVCYEASPIQKVVAFGEVCGKDDKHLYYKKTINLPIHLTRSELLEDSDLAKIFQSPQGSLLDLTETQYKKIQHMSTKERNLIYFGAPGTGKSYLLNKEAKKFESTQSGTQVTECGLTEYVERVTFHPEYTYFDFVGSYKPMMDGENIKYAFEPGPFARVLKKALSDPDKQYLLIIEEINRARVAAVFGDMFQLLDRNPNGQSEYFITPAKDLLAYLTTEEKDEEDNIIQQRAELAGEKLSLPANMFIWATMNSADQGVFPMDTAFKRRWSFKYVGIDDSEDDNKGNCAEEWKTLRKRINQLLQEAGINEDKQLGPFFLKASELEDEETFLKAFSEKVIMYLFEDAARHHRSHIFKSTNLRYSALTKEFNGTPDSIFNTPKQQNSTTSESDSEQP